MRDLTHICTGRVREGLKKRFIPLVLLILLAACDTVNPPAPTLTPTFALSAPTLEASPTYPFLPLTRSALGLDRQPGTNNLTAAALPAHAQLPPLAVTQAGGSGLAQVGFGQLVQITAPDGTLIPGMIYENLIPAPNSTPLPDGTAPQLIRTPGILLVGDAINAWGNFPQRLRDAGYTVMIAEMPDDTTTETFSAVLTSLTEWGTVEPSLIGVVGAGAGADIALVGCALDLACDAAALLSPRSRETLMNLMPEYGERPLFVAVAREDTAAVETMAGLQRVARGSFTDETYTGASEGVALLVDNGELQASMTVWLNNALVP